MKKRFIYLSLLIIFGTIASCKKDSAPIEVAGLTVNTNQKSVLPGTGINTNPTKAWVVQLADGTFVSNYGIGLKFQDFVHPLNITDAENGTPYSPTLNVGVMDLSRGQCNWVQVGNFFTAQFLTIPGGMTTNTREAMTAYSGAFQNFINGQTSSAPQYSDFAVQYGGEDQGIITITGQFILDKSSPTNVSCIATSWTVPPPLVE